MNKSSKLGAKCYKIVQKDVPYERLGYLLYTAGFDDTAQPYFRCIQLSVSEKIKRKE